jgi:hypothetical protein
MARFRHTSEKILKNSGRIGPSEEASVNDIPLSPRPAP